MMHGFMCAVNSFIFGSSFIPDFGFRLLFILSEVLKPGQTQTILAMATRDVAREAAERIMVHLDSAMTGTTSFSFVTVSRPM